MFVGYKSINENKMKNKTNLNNIKMISELIQTELEKLREQREEKYLTRKDVTKMLQVDASTVHNWTKRNILISYGIGGRVYYKKSQIEKAMIKLNNRRHDI